MDLLWCVKNMLKIKDTEQDEALISIIESMTARTLSYCKLSALPEGLEYTVAEMSVKLYKKMSEGDVSSVKRGDVTVNFSVKSVADTLDDYKNVLNAYRRARPIWGR